MDVYQFIGPTTWTDNLTGSGLTMTPSARYGLTEAQAAIANGYKNLFLMVSNGDSAQFLGAFSTSGELEGIYPAAAWTGSIALIGSSIYQSNGVAWGTTGIGNGGGPGVLSATTYNASGQLTNATVDGVAYVYGYDTQGRVSTITYSGTTLTYTYNSDGTVATVS